MSHFREAINWGPMLTPTDMFMKNGAVMACIRYLPRDMASTSREVMAQADEALNRMLMRFGSNWSLWFECQRNINSTYHYHEYRNPVSRAIENERHRYFTTPGHQYENVYVLSLLYKPKVGRVNRVASLYRDNAGDDSDVCLWLSEYKIFLSEFRSAASSLKEFMRRVGVLKSAELWTYLHRCVSIYNQMVKMPNLPVLSASSLLDCDFTSGYEPLLANHHLRTIKIDGQPTDFYTSGILDVINFAPFPLRNVSRFQPLDLNDALAELDKTRSLWDSATAPLASLLKDNMKKQQRDKSKDDPHAVLSALGTSDAILALKSGRTSFGRLTHTITVHHRDLDVVEQRCDWLTDKIRDAGFTCYVARDFDAMPAFMGSIPGHTKPDVGKLLVASINVAKLVPSTAPWTGPSWDHKLNAEPLIRCCGLGDTVFRYALHQEGSGVPHTIIDARTGAGKSVLAGMLGVSHGKYNGSNVVFIDFLASAKGVALALGGEFYGFEAGNKISLQPFRDIDKPTEMAWAVQFANGLARHLNVELTTLRTQEIKTALDILATRPPHRRTLTNFQSLVQDQELWDALGVFVNGGAYGDFLDNDSHSLGCGERVTCYEMASLLKAEDAFGPVLYTIFHEIQKRLTGDPMLLIVDEAQHLKRFPLFNDALAEYLETARKNNCAVVLITPNLREFTSDPKLSSLIARSCHTRIFGANHSAVSNEEDRAAYKAFGISDERLEVISKLKTATPDDQSHYYAFSHENGEWSVFDLKLTPMQLAFLGRNSPNDKAAMDRILEEGPREEYPQRWLRYCGFSDAEIAGFGFDVKLPDYGISQNYGLAAE